MNLCDIVVNGVAAIPGIPEDLHLINVEVSEYVSLRRLMAELLTNYGAHTVVLTPHVVEVPQKEKPVYT